MNIRSSITQAHLNRSNANLFFAQIALIAFASALYFQSVAVFFAVFFGAIFALVLVPYLAGAFCVVSTVFWAFIAGAAANDFDMSLFAIITSTSVVGLISLGINISGLAFIADAGKTTIVEN